MKIYKKLIAFNLFLVFQLGMTGRVDVWNYLNGTTMFSSTENIVLFELYEHDILGFPPYKNKHDKILAKELEKDFGEKFV